VRAVSDSASSSTGSLTVRFTAPSSGESPITGYTATCTSGNHGVTKSAPHAGAGAAPIVVGSLSTGKTYRCAVEARNAEGTGPVSSESNSVIEGSPGAPTDVAAAVVHGQIRVSFKLGPNNGSTVQSQVATCSSSNHGATRLGGHPGSVAAPIIVGSLTTGKTYTCTVQAKNARGTGLESNPSGKVVP
jgi:hypothetical protein